LKAVIADEPVAFAAADRGVGQRDHFALGAKRGEPFPNRLGSHALQPEAACRLFVPSELEQVVEDQFTFAPGIARVNDIVDIGPLEQPLDQIESSLSFLDWFESEMIRNDRKIGKAPFTALLVHLAGQAQLDEVTDCRGDHILVILKKIIFLGNFAESAGEVGGDTRLFSYHESFGHVTGFSRSDYRATA
jgi:hypothetical protein